MTTVKQKAREQSVVDVYLRTVGLHGVVDRRERPDFCVVMNGRTIGIEVTEYHQPKQAYQRFSRTTVEAEWRKLSAAVAGYREREPGLENLSVELDFSSLILPDRKSHGAFIEAVHAEITRVLSGRSKPRMTIGIGNHHPQVLRQYLRSISVRSVGCYMEWDWNHSFAGVGTSDDELLSLLRHKLNLVRPEGIDELHLVVAGDGPTGGSYVGYLFTEWLDRWVGLNEALRRSDYAVAAILNYEKICLWRREQGWSSVKYRAGSSA